MKETVSTFIGRYQGSGRGFGFFTPEGAADRTRDWFIPPRQDGGAWDGDTVEVMPQAEDPTQPGRRTAYVTAIITRGNPTVTGTIRKIDHSIWLVPDNQRLPAPIKVMGRVKLREGEKAAVAVTSYGGASIPPMGTLKASFGPAGTRSAAVEAVLFQQDIFREFPQEVYAALPAIPQEVSPKVCRGRLDLRGETVITIDGASSKDLDDAVSLKREGENWVLGVHIADVSHYVTPGSPIDLEAFARGTSVYFADQVIPMLPVALSNGICSLNPQVDRLTLSCFMTLSPRGEVLDHTIARSVIRSSERMTYSDCNLLLDDAQKGSPLRQALEEKYAHILPMLQDMAALAGQLENRRKGRGSLDLESSESAVLCDSQGEPVDIVARSQGVSERLIESFMLAANETVARHLAEAGFPAVYRIHEKPSQEKTDTLKAMLSPLGYTIREADSFSLQKVLDDAKGRPEAPAISMMILRSMMKARYDEKNLGHFGIAAPYYCHFTSPIRRYPDLMVHRCLHALLDGGRGAKKLAKACGEAAVQSSRRELAAQTAEREIDKLYFADFMHGHLGEEFPAVVSGVTRSALFAALPFGVEGVIPAETLPEGHYDYDEDHMTLSGAGMVYTLGTPLRVVCVSADPGTGRIEFRLPGREDIPSRRQEEVQPPIPGRRPAPKGKGKPKSKGRGGRAAMHVPKKKKRGKER